MVRIATLGLLIAGTTPIALTNSSQGISLSSGLQFPFEPPQATVQTDCDRSTFSCPTKTSNFALTDSDFWLQGTP